MKLALSNAKKALFAQKKKERAINYQNILVILSDHYHAKRMEGVRILLCYGLFCFVVNIRYEAGTSSRNRVLCETWYEKKQCILSHFVCFRMKRKRRPPIICPFVYIKRIGLCKNNNQAKEKIRIWKATSDVFVILRWLNESCSRIPVHTNRGITSTTNVVMYIDRII